MNLTAGEAGVAETFVAYFAFKHFAFKHAALLACRGLPIERMNIFLFIARLACVALCAPEKEVYL